MAALQRRPCLLSLPFGGVASATGEATSVTLRRARASQYEKLHQKQKTHLSGGFGLLWLRTWRHDSR